MNIVKSKRLPQVSQHSSTLNGRFTILDVTDFEAPDYVKVARLWGNIVDPKAMVDLPGNLSVMERFLQEDQRKAAWNDVSEVGIFEHGLDISCAVLQGHTVSDSELATNGSDHKENQRLD